MARIFPIAKDGWRFILPLVVIGGGLIFVPVPLVQVFSAILLLAALFCAYFFRDFDRNTPADSGAIYCPGDGKILEVAEVESSPVGPGWVVRIFLSVLDGHVQRSPIDGQVENIEYKKGSFLDARDPKAHIDNEQNALTLNSPKGKLVVTQVAGLIARRIVCWTRKGDQLKQGQRYGLIRFGSQVDLFLPKNVSIEVKPKQRVWGGTTVMARWQ